MSRPRTRCRDCHRPAVQPTLDGPVCTACGCFQPAKRSVIRTIDRLFTGLYVAGLFARRDPR